MDSLCLLSYIKRVGMWSSIESNVHVSCQRGHGPDPVLELSGPEQALNDLGPVRGSYLLHDECHGEVFSYTTRSGSSPLLAFLWHSTPCSLTSSPCICPLAFPWMTNSFWPTGDKEQQLIVFWLTFFLQVCNIQEVQVEASFRRSAIYQVAEDACLLGCQRAAKHVSRMNTEKQGGSAWFCSSSPDMDILSDFNETFYTNARSQLKKGTSWFK